MVIEVGNAQVVQELEVRATPEAIWRALVDPALTKRYFYGEAFQSSLLPGAPYVYGDEKAPCVEGTVVSADAPRRLELTASYRSQWLFSPEAREDPPHRVVWEIEPLGSAVARDDAASRCRMRLTCDGFAGETQSWRHASRMMPAVLKSLRHVVDPASKPARLERIGGVTVRELTPELREDFLRFFDEDAFADNPYWGACYCTAHHCGDSGTRTPTENRATAAELVHCARMQGFLAYIDGRPAAWCNAAPRPTLAGLALDTKLAVDDAERVGSIVCFVVAAPYRRHGLARALLDAAVARLRDQGLLFAEAYPSRGQRFGGPGGDSDLCLGPLELYLGAGFEVYRDLGNRLIVRKALS
jgi:GNAT superfamily N-acetyltransferase/uncharacterized protein YndB with AHSA1/START domain